MSSGVRRFRILMALGALFGVGLFAVVWISSDGRDVVIAAYVAGVLVGVASAIGIGIVERVVGADRLGIKSAIGVLVGSSVVDLVLSVALELNFRAVLGASFVGIMFIAATPIWRPSAITGRPNENRGGAS